MRINGSCAKPGTVLGQSRVSAAWLRCLHPSSRRCCPIQGAPATLSRPPRALSHVVRRASSQDDVDGPAGPLVPAPDQQNLPAVPSGAGGPGRVPVQFVVPEYLTHWGQVLKVVGSLEELGSWTVEKAPSMQWNEGHTWTLDVQLPVGAVNFKIVMHDQPNSAVRWELGEDRSVLIPETTTVTGAPVGQVGVTCNFNDVHNSRVEVRPDRAYLKQQLKAVEARVLAIQSKKRKLDQRMSVLTDGLKKYDATVAMLSDGVAAAVDARRSSKESKSKQLQQQQPQPAQPQELQQAAVQAQAQPQQTPSSNGVPANKQQQQAARFNPLGTKESIQVPILHPSQLPSFAEASASASAAAAAPAEEDPLTATTSGSSIDADRTATSSTSTEEEDAAQQQADADTLVAAADSSSSGSSASLVYAPDVGAIKASHVNETVLSATVDQLLAAAEDALARSTPSSEPLPNSLTAGTAGVDDVQLAEEYVEELLAAASALEQQADRRASLLLEAAQQAGDRDMAADIEQLAAAELPPIPTVEELAEAAAAAAALTISSLDDAELSAAVAAAVSVSSISSSDEESAAPVAAAVPVEQPQQVVLEVQLEQQPQQQPQQQQQEARGAGGASGGQRVEKDGSITFTAESLKAEVDVKQLLSGLLSRLGIPLGRNVTISASFTPNEAAARAAVQDTAAAAGVMDAAAEASMDLNLDSMAASSSSSGSSGPSQEQQQQQQREEKPKQQLSPVDAIAAVLSRGNSLDTQDDDDSSSSSSGGGGSSGGGSSSGSSPNSRSGGFRNTSSTNTNSNGGGSSRGRYSKAVATGSEQPYSPAATTAAAAGGARQQQQQQQQQRPSQPAARLDPQDLSRQLEAKEAARRAAAERVAAALAQVEEVRRSFVAANSMLSQQLTGTEEPAPGTSSTAVSTSTAVSNGNGSSSSVQTSDGRVYSKFRVVQKGSRQPAAAAPAADAASSSSSIGAKPGAAVQPDPVSAPGAPRGLPAVAATAVEPSPAVLQPEQAQQQQQWPEVEGEVREELSLLAALAAEVQKQGQKGTQH